MYAAQSRTPVAVPPKILPPISVAQGFTQVIVGSEMEGAPGVGKQEVDEWETAPS